MFSKYGPTPPIVQQSSTGTGNEALSSNDGGVLKTMTQEVMEMGLIDDDQSYNLCVYAVREDRTFQVQTFVEVYDPAGGRVAAGSAIQQVTRLGSGNIEPLVGTPLFLTFTPDVPASWDSATVTALLAIMPSGTDLCVRVARTALPSADLRWRATLKVIGAQAQIVT